MDSIETFHHKPDVVADTVGFRFEADLFKSVLTTIGFVVVDNIETFHHQKMFAAESFDFRFEAHFFKSVPMILGCRCLNEH